MKKFLLIIMAVFWASTAHAANWYLDKAATGSNNGTSWSNAWTSPASVVWGSSGVKAGDTLYIGAGSYGNLSIGASGTSSNPVTIRAAQDAGHTGVATFNGGGTGPAIRTNDRPYITINGEFNGARNIKAYNGRLSTGYDYVISAPNYATGCKFLYLEVATGASGIGAYNQGANPLEIAHCYIHDIRGQAGIVITTCGDRATYGIISIHDNILSTNWSVASGSVAGPDGLQARGSVDYYNNIVYGVKVSSGIVGGQHPDMIQAQAEYWRIYNNHFYNFGDSAIDFDTFFQQHVQHVQIYNNVFSLDVDRSSFPQGIRFYNSSGNVTDFSNVTIANNTFVDILGYRVLWVGNNSGMTISNTKIQNNIFYDCGSIYLGSSSGVPQAGWGFDYNDINAGSSGQSASNVLLGGASYTQAHPRTGTPAFMSYTKWAPSNDFHLSPSDTAAKGQGVSLSTYFTTDRDGNTRTLPWDIGAYAYQYTLTLAPPTSLKVQ